MYALFYCQVSTGSHGQRPREMCYNDKIKWCTHVKPVVRDVVLFVNIHCQICVTYDG